MPLFQIFFHLSLNLLFCFAYLNEQILPNNKQYTLRVKGRYVEDLGWYPDNLGWACLSPGASRRVSPDKREGRPKRPKRQNIENNSIYKNIQTRRKPPKTQEIAESRKHRIFISRIYLSDSSSGYLIYLRDHVIHISQACDAHRTSVLGSEEVQGAPRKCLEVLTPEISW